MVKVPSGETVRSRGALLCVSVDLPARAIVNNFIQYNGYYGCGQCLQKGLYTVLKLCYVYEKNCFLFTGKRIKLGPRSSVQTYPYMEADPGGPLRDHSTTVVTAKQAFKDDRVVSPHTYTCIAVFTFVSVKYR